jgi:hypothetical protein
MEETDVRNENMKYGKIKMRRNNATPIRHAHHAISLV